MLLVAADVRNGTVVTMLTLTLFRRCSLVAVLAVNAAMSVARAATPQEGRFLYVATPGIRDYLEYGGHGVLVYDIDHGHRLVRRIASAGVDGIATLMPGVCT